MKLRGTFEPPIPKDGVINTGKVLIGLRYRKPVQVDIDKDMRHLQSALLGTKQRRLSDVSIAFFCAALVVLVLLLSRLLP